MNEKPLAKVSLVRFWATRLSVFVGFMTLMLVGGGLAWLAQNYEDLLAKTPIEHVVVHATLEHVSATELEAHIDHYLHAGFFGVDLEALQASLEERPWISRAAVSRSWPATIKVRVIERTPIAVWANNQLLDHQGVLFSPKTQRSPVSEEGVAISAQRQQSARISQFDKLDLPILDAPDQYVGPVMEQFQKMSRVLRTVDAKIARLKLTSSMSWQIELDNGVLLKLDRYTPIEKLKKWVNAYPQLMAMEREIDQVDLRYLNGFSVKWKDELS